MSFNDPMSRCPYFFFQDREHGVNADASKEAGYEVPLMMTFILVTPHGHRGDPMEFFAEEFIERKTREAREGRYDQSWIVEFKAGLIAHRDGKEIPRHGTPLVTWERILKTRRVQLSSLYPTVEDLAAVPDSALGGIGLDGRVLRDMARGDIQSKKDLSPVVKELANANETIRRQQEQIDKLTARFDAMETMSDESPRRGRPRKEAVDSE